MWKKNIFFSVKLIIYGFRPLPVRQSLYFDIPLTFSDKLKIFFEPEHSAKFTQFIKLIKTTQIIAITAITGSSIPKKKRITPPHQRMRSEKRRKYMIILRVVGPHPRQMEESSVGAKISMMIGMIVGNRSIAIVIVLDTAGDTMKRKTPMPAV